MIDLKDFEYSELEAYLISIGEKKFRAAQIYKWLHMGVTSYDEMTDISKSLRLKLSENTYVSTLEIEQKFVSQLDGTVKYLFRLPDGNCIESVVMRYHHGLTICISSQIGCRMGCRFCASTIGGLYRSLTAGEILNQVIFAEKDMGERISNIVIMGIGEPLDNYDNVIKFLHNVNHEKGKNIGYRHITLSTCGVVPGIYKLADEGMPITLTISLHAPNDEIRSSVMPINHKYRINELIKACKYYVDVTGRRLSFEYSLIHGVNDSIKNADELAALVKQLHAHVNLIPVNKVEERSFVKGTKDEINAFRDRLIARGVNATIRRELGSDISASCGQLRKKAVGIKDTVNGE
ncbi:MAG: 23S rRNA (adenine(2503)-C(2))-methyltransferase RlmN [Oscillospiraceae bacterium]|nr:23S rRNA (adenine(2503)-C(2))-methyltransferase RlmN [Oscillospiraceae bacterium]